MRQRILFVDNHADFRQARAEYLLDAGYDVIHAGSSKEAEAILRDQWVHLALFDIRMDNDDDSDDTSGLRLAKEAAHKAIPKIMLTNHPSIEAVRDALGLTTEDIPPAVGFLDKAEGPDAMLQAISTAFERDVRINWTLHIQSGERQPVTLPYLATLIEPALGGDLLSYRAGELEDAFRRLFHEQHQIRLERLLWHQKGRIALSVLAFTRELPPTAFLVVCGSRDQGLDEALAYETYAPKAIGPTSTILSLKSETTHFAINAYTLVHVELEQVQSLIEHYHNGSEKGFNTALENLFQQTLAAWHRQLRVPEEHNTLISLYCNRLKLTEPQLPREVFEERLDALARQLHTIGVRIESMEGQVTISSFGHVATYPDPIPFIYGAFDRVDPVLLVNAPGQLTGESVLTDANGVTWVTDFADAGLVPELWSYVALEAAIRFDWIDPLDLKILYVLAQILTTSQLQHVTIQDVEPSALRKPVRAIQTVRRLAADQSEASSVPYSVGLLLQAVSRLATFEPVLHLTPNELTRFAYIWMCAAMTTQQLNATDLASTGPQKTGLYIDQPNRAVWVNGRRVRLRGQNYDLLCYLYDRAGQLCHRRELVEHVFSESFNDFNESQRRRLNTAISRLRDRLGDDRRQPRYLFTETGVGYRLVTQPSTLGLDGSLSAT